MITKKILESFNSPDALGIISSYPLNGEEIALKNAISRYTYLIAKNLPADQKIVIFCEKRGLKKAFLHERNILVVPSYRVNSAGFLRDLIYRTSEFNLVENFLVQFEFSMFGGKIIIPQFLEFLAFLKLGGKSVKVSLHQVVTDLGNLSGHLAIGRRSIKTLLLNIFLKIFYISLGVLSDKIFVHDLIFQKRLRGLIDESKIRVIPHGFDMQKGFSSKSSNLQKKYFGVKPGTKLIGIFGYCSWYKGTDWLIENFAAFVNRHPEAQIKLLVAGGESPTLKGTLAYKKYHAKLKEVIRKADDSIVYTGYVPEKNIEKVFRACDLIVFPYRTKMSTSGAFSLCVGYKKPFIASRGFSVNYGKKIQAGNIFSLAYESFEKCLLNNIKSPKPVDLQNNFVTWREASLMYIRESLQNDLTEPELSYAKAV